MVAERVRDIRVARSIKQAQQKELQRLQSLSASQRQAEIKKTQSSIISDRGLKVIERFEDGSVKRAVKQISKTQFTSKFNEIEIIFNRQGFRIKEIQKQRFTFRSGKGRQSGRVVKLKTINFENGIAVGEIGVTTTSAGRITSNFSRDFRKGVETIRETPASEVAGAEGKESAFNIQQQLKREREAEGERRRDVLIGRIIEKQQETVRRGRGITLAEKIIAAREPKKGERPTAMRPDGLAVSAVFDPQLFGTDVRPSELKPKGPDITQLALTAEFISQLEKGEGTPIKFTILDLPPPKKEKIADIPESQFRLAPTFAEKVLFFGPREGEGTEIQRILQRGEALLKATASEARELRLTPSEDLTPIQEFAKDVGAGTAEFFTSAGAGAIGIIRDPVGTAKIVLPIIAATAIAGPVAGVVVATAPSFIQTGLGRKSDISILAGQVAAAPLSLSGEIAGQVAVIGGAIKTAKGIPKRIRTFFGKRELAKLPGDAVFVSEAEIRRVLGRGGIEQPSGQIQTTFGEELRTITQEQAARLRAEATARGTLKRPVPPSQFVVQETGPGTDILFLQEAQRVKPLTQFGFDTRISRIIRGRSFAQQQIKVPKDVQTFLVEPTVKGKPLKPFKPFDLPGDETLVTVTEPDFIPFTGETAVTLKAGALQTQQIGTGPTIVQVPLEQAAIAPPINIFEQLKGFQPTPTIVPPSIVSPAIITGAFAAGIPRDRVREEVRARERFIVIQAPDVRVEEAQVQVQVPLSDLRAEVETLLDQEARVRQRQIPEVKPVVDVGDIQIQAQEEAQRQIPIVIPDIFPDQITFPEQIQRPIEIVEPVPPSEPITGFGIRLPEVEARDKIPERKVEAYDSFTRRRGKFVQRNKGAVSKRLAFDIGAEVVDRSLDATLKVVKRPKKLPQSKVNTQSTGYLSRNRFKFRDFSLKRKSVKLRDRLIERNKFRLDSPEERSQISAAKVAAQINKRISKPRRQPKRSRGASIGLRRGLL